MLLDAADTVVVVAIEAAEATTVAVADGGVAVVMVVLVADLLSFLREMKLGGSGSRDCLRSTGEEYSGNLEAEKGGGDG